MRCLVLFIYGFFSFCDCINLFARTRNSLVLVELDVRKNSLVSRPLVDDISDDTTVSLTFHGKRNLGIYAMKNIIYAVNLSNGSSHEIGKIGSELEEHVTSIAYDWVTDQIYVALPGIGHESDGRIFLCTFQTQFMCSVIFYQRMEYIFHISLDPLDGNMYWLNVISRSIEKSFMNGLHHDTHPYDDILNGVDGGGAMLSSLTLHRPSKSLYFIRTVDVSSEIWSCELYKRNSCKKQLTLRQIVQLAVANEHLVWSDSRGHLNVCSIGNCSSSIVSFADSLSLETFVVADSLLQPEWINDFPNPCSSTENKCSHFCSLVHFAPWSTCGCPLGVRLLDDQKTCDPRGVDKVLLVSAIGGIFTIPLENSDFSPQAIQFEGYNSSTHKLYDIDYDPVEQKVYWIDADRGYIRCSSLDGTSTKNVVRVPSSVKIFRIDYLNRNLYWIDSKLPRIYVTSLFSKQTSIMVSGYLAKPRGLALNLKKGIVYFADSDAFNSRIESCKLDGSERKTLINLTDHAWPNAIVVDSDEGRIYWTEGNYSVIKTANINGSDSMVIGPAAQKLLQPYGITKLGDTIFCNSLGGRALMKTVINITTGEIRSNILESAIFGPIGIKAVSLHTVVNSSSTCASNGGCDHICVPGRDAVKCLCATGYELQDDLRSCSIPDAFAIIPFSKPFGDIGRISLGRVKNMKFQGLLTSTMSSLLKSIDYDQKSELVYLAGSDMESGFILRSNLDGTLQKYVLRESSLVGIDSVSVDYVTKNVYWSNSLTKRVEVCDHSGSFRRTIAWRNIHPTKLIVYSPNKSILFVSQGPNATIKSVPFTGSPDGGVDILGDLDLVTSLSIDFRTELFYWSEDLGDLSKVSVSRLDGTNRETLFVGQDVRPSYLFAFNFKLYFADSHDLTFGYYNNREFTIIHENVPARVGLIIAHGSVPSVTDICANSSVCPELCLSQQSVHTGTPCVCRDHYTWEPATNTCLAPDNFVLIGAVDAFRVINIRKLPDRSFSWTEDPVRVLSIPVKDRVVSLCMDLITRFLFWISEEDLYGYIHFTTENSSKEAGRIDTRNDCEYFYSLAVDDVGRQLYASCKTRLGYGSIIVYGIENEGRDPLRYIGEVVAGSRKSEATGYQALPRNIALFPFLNYLFYVDVSPNLPTPSIIQCQMDGRTCSLWYSNDLWPLTRLHADSPNLRLFYTSLSGVWSRDVGMASSNVRHHFHSINASDYSVAPIDENTILVAEISNQLTRVIEVSSNTVLDVSNLTTSLQRFGPTSPLFKECEEANCSHLCRVVRDSKKKHQCSCPLDFAIDTERPWNCLRNVICKPWEFACQDGRTCIHAAKKCDRVLHCSDGSDESANLCMADRANWPCDDGASSIDHSLLCNGYIDCEDGSDERHCRCPAPSSQFDCGANPLFNSSECADRKRLCDGFADCENGMDEDPKLCEHVPRPTIPYQSSPEWIYGALLALIFFVIASFLVFCCFRHHPYCAPVPSVPETRYRSERGTEASILLPNSTGITQFEVALRRSSIDGSMSSCPALPPPNSSQTYSSNGLHSHKEEIPLSRFYAPPPSAASLSTYGVVKPSEIRFVRRNHGRRNTKASPPPGYTTVYDSTVDSISGLSQQLPQMSSTPKSIKADRMACSSKLGSPIVPNNSRQISSASDSAVLPNQLRPSSPASSSLSSHSSEQGFAGNRR